MSLRVMQVSQHGELRGGAEFYCLMLTEQLVARGIAVEVICGDDGSLARELRRLGVPVHVLPLAHYGIYEHMKEVLVVDWPTVERIEALLRAFRPHVVHGHLMPAHLHAALAALDAGVPGVLYTEHNFAVAALNVLLSRFTRSRTIVPSRAAFELLTRGGIPPDHVSVIEHGIGPEYFAADEGAVAAARASLGLRDGPVIGTIARLSPEKAIDTLLAATRRVVAAIPSLTLLIVGDGPLEDDLRRQARELGLENAVRFLGFRPDVSVLMRLMDVFILPSRMESVGLVLLEAMAAGRPVVATTVGAIPEYVDQDRTGLLAPPDDPEALAGAIQRLLDDPALRTRLGAAGRVKAEAHFTLDRMVTQTIQLYCEAAGIQSPALAP